MHYGYKLVVLIDWVMVGLMLNKEALLYLEVLFQCQNRVFTIQFSPLDHHMRYKTDNVLGCLTYQMKFVHCLALDTVCTDHLSKRET